MKLVVKLDKNDSLRKTERNENVKILKILNRSFNECNVNDVDDYSTRIMDIKKAKYCVIQKKMSLVRGSV